VEVVLRDPGAVETLPFGVDDLLGGEAIALAGAGPVQEPGEKAQPFRSCCCGHKAFRLPSAWSNNARTEQRRAAVLTAFSKRRHFALQKDESGRL
jgi:hypothetical protein